MLIGISGKRPGVFNTKINDYSIPQTSSRKYLLVYNVNKLTWSDGITNLEKQTRVVLKVSIKLNQCVSNGCHLGH